MPQQQQGRHDGAWFIGGSSTWSSLRRSRRHQSGERQGPPMSSASDPCIYPSLAHSY